MARLRAELKRGFLRSLWRAAASTKTVEGCLSDFQASAFQWVRLGKIVTSSSGAGYANQWAEVSSQLELSPIEVFALSEEFIAIYTDVMAANPAYSAEWFGDAADPIVDTMMDDDRMHTVRSVSVDNIGLRLSYGNNLTT